MPTAALNRRARHAGLDPEPARPRHLTLREAALQTGMRLRTLRGWRHRGKIPVERTRPHVHYVTLDTLCRHILSFHEAPEERQTWVSTGAAADKVGVRRATFYNYVGRGIPVPHIDPAVISRIIQGARCLTYDPNTRRLTLRAQHHIHGGYGYLDTRTVIALQHLNRAHLENWPKLSQYAQRLLQAFGSELPPDRRRQVKRKIAHLCATGQITANRGLQPRQWYIHPCQANHPTLLHMSFAHGRFLLVFSPPHDHFDTAVRMAVQHPGCAKDPPRAAIYDIGEAHVALVIGQSAVLTAWRECARPIPASDLAMPALQSALHVLTAKLSHQRRPFLPLCQAPQDDIWNAIASFFRRKTRYRRLLPSEDPAECRRIRQAS